MADKAIVTMDGVDADKGLTTLRMEGVNTLRSILLRARKRILVADSSKIGLESHCFVEDISCVDVLVTNWTEEPQKQDTHFTCEKCGAVLKPYEDANGKTVPIRKHAAGSMEKFGAVYCLSCIEGMRHAGSDQ